MFTIKQSIHLIYSSAKVLLNNRGRKNRGDQPGSLNHGTYGRTLHSPHLLQSIHASKQKTTQVIQNRSESTGTEETRKNNLMSPFA